MTQFATALQLSQYLTGNPETVDELDPAFVRQAEIMLEMVSADVQSAAGATIEAGTGTVYLDGVYGQFLELPQRPVQSVASVSVNGQALAATAYTFEGGQLLRRGPAALLDDVDDDLATFGGALPAFDRSHWGGPSARITVVYSWGSETLPVWIQGLTLRATARVIGNPSDLSQETLGIYSSSYRDRTADGSHILKTERDRLRRAFNRTAGSFRAT